jgi:predicted nucleic acid-binding protein
LFLLDTNVVSELRRARPHGAVVAWLAPIPSSALFVSAVSVGEIQSGIEITRKRDAKRAAEIELWLDKVLQTFQVLDLDAASFRTWAKLMQGRSDDQALDAMIAAMAIVRGLSVATRNVRDFRGFGADIVNPFVAAWTEKRR